MKKYLTNIILILIFLIGVSLLLYPSIADWWNTKIFNEEIAYYTSEISMADTSEIDELLAEAKRYNEVRAQRGNSFVPLKKEEFEIYNKQLSLNGNSMMGYVSIPKIHSYLPIFHTTEDAVLAAGVGHVEGTSLPIGGENTHCVLSGHRGLPSARLFTDLDQVVTGDTFVLEIYGLTLTYEVDQILIVLPQELSALQIEPGMDYCTLVTCTPYGVNSHRMLVRGHRISNANGEIRVTTDAIQIRPALVAPFVAAPMLLVLLLLLFTVPAHKDEDD